MIPKRAPAICLELERDDKDPSAGGDPNTRSCKRRRLWSTEDYEAMRALGRGAYGEVVEARHRATGEAVAVKALRAPDAGAAKTKGAATNALLREAGFLAACRGHPALVNLHALAVNPNTGDVALVMECVGPSLHDVLYGHRHRGGRPFPEPDVRRIMQQLLNGARHMHSRRVMHRDIKLDNILVDGRGFTGGSVSVKICDFGLAASVFDDQSSYEWAGTRPYMAPEVLLGKRDYDVTVDMWSLGCVMAQLLTGTQLFDGKADDIDQILEIFKVLGVPGPRTWPGFMSLPLAGTVPMPLVRHCNRLRQLVRKDRLSDQGFNLLKRLLSCNSDKRLSATAALRSPWFTQDAY